MKKSLSGCVLLAYLQLITVLVIWFDFLCCFTGSTAIAEASWEVEEESGHNDSLVKVD